MTFSIVARSTDGQSWGVAVASKFLGVGAAVPAARVGAGAVATQSYANTSYKPRALTLLADGATADVTLQALLADDVGRDQRQVGIVDRRGGATTYTGSGCHDWAGGVTLDGVAIQGNILVGPAVVDAMRAAWDETDPDMTLSRRLLAALRAGDAAGGDRRGRQSAALLVVRAGAGYAGFDDVAVDLRVDDHPQPCEEMARLVDLHELYNLPPDPSELLPLTDDLRVEIDGLARSVGQADFGAWVGCANFENRAWPDKVDPKVLQILRDQAGRAS
ncbi:MAG: DUF1028 domain-containing protein [Nocardioidaceae bacterium]